MSRITYAQTYNTAYRMVPKRINNWAVRSIKRSRNYQTRIRRSTHILTIAKTQRIGTHLTAATRDFVSTQLRLATLCWIITRLRPLQKRIIEYLWRPQGAMFRRHFPQDMLSDDITSMPIEDAAFHA